MDILFSVSFLDGYHGSVMHVWEWAKAFRAMGHQVAVASIWSTAEIRVLFTDAGITHYTLTDGNLPTDWDIVFAYHFPSTGLLLAQGIQPQHLVLGSLSGMEPLETLPACWPAASHIVMVSETAKAQHHAAYGIPLDSMSVVENGIPEEFTPLAPLTPQVDREGHVLPRRIAVVSNHPPKVLKALQWKSPVPVDIIGQTGNRYGVMTPELLRQYDLVITIGKTVQYAMGLGIPVFEYDHFGGNGYVTTENFDAERAHNFSGRPQRRELTLDVLLSELFSGYEAAFERREALLEHALTELRLAPRLTALLECIAASPALSLEDLEAHAGHVTLLQQQALAYAQITQALKRGQKDKTRTRAIKRQVKALFWGVVNQGKAWLPLRTKGLVQPVAAMPETPKQKQAQTSTTSSTLERRCHDAT